MGFIKDKNPSWLSNVGVVTIGEGFKDYSENINNMIGIIEEDNDDLPSSHYELKGDLAKFKQTYRQMDTSVGGCDVFNPYWQFGIDDDIIHPINDITPNKDGTAGMGSIYNEMIYDTQKKLDIMMGVPKFSGLSSFFLDDNTMLGKLMKDGKPPLGLMIGNLIGTVAGLAIKIPVWPIIVSNYIGEKMTNPIKSTKYFDFKPAMPLYFRLVNSIFSALCVNMGLAVNGLDLTHTGGVRESALMYLDKEDQPDIMRNGPDIFAILNKRNRRCEEPNPGNITTSDALLKEHQNAPDESPEDQGIWSKLTSGFKDGMSGVNNWMSFRIEKNADASETLNNETGESEIASSLNSTVSQQRNMMFKIQGGKVGVIPEWASDVFGFVKDILVGATQSLGGNAAVQMATGNGFFDIPHDWKNSTWSKNHNFSIKLRARYGDPVSIIQSLYLPLSLWLAASAPRAIGNNLYTSPFLLQAYCKGLFSVPLGIVESLSIKRGGPEFGWNRTGLPLALTLDVTIKDLTPTMFISMTDNESSLFNVSVRNTAMLDYLATLAGIGTFARTAAFATLLRSKQAAVLRLKNTLFNPYFWGLMIGDNMGVFKGIYQMSPWARGPEKFPPIGRSFQ